MSLDIEIAKLLVSSLTPLVVLILGLRINRTLEKNKADLSKKKDFETWWAEKFLLVSDDLNTAVSKQVNNIWLLTRISRDKPGWEEEYRKIEYSVNESTRLIQQLDWEIQNYIQFAPVKGKEVYKEQKELFDLLADVIASGNVDFERIRMAQFKFNESVQVAHAEILGILPQKQLQPISRLTGC